MSTSTRKVSARWAELFAAIPGYDPIATATPGDVFDASAANRALRFFPACLKHVKGARAGHPLELQPWQQAIIACLFGWKRSGGTRRYRDAFIYVPRKNGKTTLIAGVIIYALYCDDEPGAEIYGAASDYKQACLLFEQVVGMIRQDEDLAAHCRIFDGHGMAKAITRESTFSAYRPISSDAKTKDGFNTHLYCIDELHAQPDAELLDKLKTSVGARTQPLGVCITTADYDRPSVCNETLTYARNVRDGLVKAPSFLPAIWEAPKDADWTSPDTWRIANPNLGVSLGMDYLEEECRRAREVIRLENTFRRYHLNQVTEQESRWIKLEDWRSCTINIPDDYLKGRRCCAGIDLSKTGDMTAVVLAFPDGADSVIVVPFFFLPADGMVDRGLRDKMDYASWVKDGWLELTPGNVVDYEYVEDYIRGLAADYDIIDYAYDPWNAWQFAQRLEAQGCTMIEFRQGYRTMSDPSKEFERLILSGKLKHGGHPILDWHAQNVCVTYDPSGTLIKPVKTPRKEGKKVDGVIAAIMAVARARAIPESISVYETSGLKVF